MKILFFELIQVAIGLRANLSKTPSHDEWYKLYDIAQKQALLGICFTGVQNLKEQNKNVPRALFFQWLAITTKIQQQNELMNNQTKEICNLAAKTDIKHCVLKGQSVAYLYGKLAFLRQAGDIDVWFMASSRDVIEWGKKTGHIYFYDYHHADLDYFKDTEVELHYRPTLSRNLIRNYRLQHWFFKQNSNLSYYNKDLEFNCPRYDFNLILTLNHNFWHLLYEGVGLRQMMDLYFILKTQKESFPESEIKKKLDYFGLRKFAGASMWVMHEVFCLPKEYLICKPDQKRGQHLLEEIMIAGNFGHYDKRIRTNKNQSRIALFLKWLKHSIRLLGDYPADVLWTPVGIIRISLWRRWHYFFDKRIRKEEVMTNT